MNDSLGEIGKEHLPLLDGKNDENEPKPKDPENYLEMLQIVAKVSIGPIISMFFYMFV